MASSDGVDKSSQARYPLAVESEQEARVLSLVRQADGVSRSTLAAGLGMSRSAVGLLLDGLMDRGLIRESGPGSSNGGRRPRLLVYHKDTGYVISVDLGATSLDVSISNLNAEILVHKVQDADVRQGPESVLADVVRLIDGAIEEADVDRALIRGMGMGVPGPVEFRTGLPISPPIMPGWHRFNIRTYFEERFRCPVFVDNDVNIMALGERWAGTGRQIEDFLFVKIGTGLGCGIVCRGEIYRGVDGCAGDIGHIEATSEPIVCRCGKFGCLEALVGGDALARDAEEAARTQKSPHLARLLEEKGSLSAADLSLAIEQGDPVSLQLARAASALLGKSLARLVNFYNPGLVILGGGVANLGNSFLASVREVIYQRSLPLATSHLLIQRSELGNEAGVIGAAAMVLGELYKISPMTTVVRSGR